MKVDTAKTRQDTHFREGVHSHSIDTASGQQEQCPFVQLRDTLAVFVLAKRGCL